MMNFNDNNNRLITHSRRPNIQNYQGWYPCLFSQDKSIQELQHKQKKKSRGNRKLQRYRRKLRNQGMDTDTIMRVTDAWVDIDSEEKSEVIEQNIETTNLTVNETMFHGITVAEKNKTHAKIYKHGLVSPKQSNLKRLIHTNEVNSLTSVQQSKRTSTSNNSSIDYTNVLDQIFFHMLSTAFNDVDKLGHFLNEKEKLEFIREYTILIDRLSYVKLQEQQWNYYYHTGMTQNIWSGHISKPLSKKNSICNTYGRSKLFIEQYRKKFPKQLSQAQYRIELFEKEILFKSAQHIDCSSEIKMLSFILNTFVYEKQQKLREEFEYKRQMLILDAVDHRLMQAFYNLKPNSSQVTIDSIVFFIIFLYYFQFHSIIDASARRIWRETTKHIIMNEQIAILKQLLISKQPLLASTLFDHTINRIETSLTQLDDVMVQDDKSASVSSSQFETMNQLKHNIINQSIITAREMAENSAQIILDETQKLLSLKHDDQHSHELHITVVNAIEDRRFHMMQRGNYMIQEKLATYLRQN
ncbi:unnamed protein product [Adineta steineri]|uniref:Uncharacterized protein n=1 Tax=Adineta steineri TaxID=433720 RepID=A0A815Q2B8_9BILA|nr:unnamed protein product [Adineta steineri]CAF4055801.1 unnamed protein product [Adineta steineri]